MSQRPALGTALFFAVVVATLVTSVLVVRARTPDLVLEVLEPGVNQQTGFRPGPSPLPNAVSIEFFVRESDPHAVVAIVDSRENVVRTLDSDVALTEDKPVRYRWDGTTDAGQVAPPGRYRLSVELPSENREMVFPRRFTLIPGGRG